MSVLEPYLILQPANRRYPSCDACIAQKMASRAAVVHIPAQKIQLCREHAMEAANELAQAAEQMLEYASKPEVKGYQYATKPSLRRSRLPYSARSR